jgi:uncharacterized membrane protein
MEATWSHIGNLWCDSCRKSRASLKNKDVDSTDFYLCDSRYVLWVGGGIHKNICRVNQPRLIAAGSQLVIGLVMLPLVIVFPPNQSLIMPTVLLMIVFSIFCSAVAYMIFYRLVANVGPTKTLTVSFLMPAIGMLWGHLFLGETITCLMILGALIILTGTFLVSFDTKLLPASS